MMFLRFPGFGLVLFALFLFPFAGLSRAADGPSDPLGRVTGTGPLHLRGIQVVDEGTVFPGSRIRTGDEAYGNIRFRGGLIVELDSQTDVLVDADGSVVRVAMESGGFSFSSRGSEQSLSLDFDDFSIVGNPGSAGSVRFLPGDRLDVAPLSGTVGVVDHDTGDRFLLREGISTVITLGPLDPVAEAMAADVLATDPSAFRNDFFGSFRFGFGAFFGGPVAFKFFNHHSKKASPHEPGGRPPRGRGVGRGPRHWPPPPWRWRWW